MHLDDITQALLASYRNDGGINHVDGANLPSQASVNQLAATIRDILGHTGAPEYIEPRAGEIHFSQADISLASAHIGYFPEVAFEEALRSLMSV